jgi:hypothetical protein
MGKESHTLSLLITKKQYELPTEGIHTAVIKKIDDLGLQETPWGNKEQVLIVLEMLDQKAKETGEAIQMRIYAGKSLHEKSTLGKMLDQLKISHTDEFDLSSVIGLKVRVIVAHKTSTEGKERAIPALFMPFGQSNTAADTL